MKNPQVLIRKYSDRPVFDTGASRYIKLDDLARMVREGSDVCVVDRRSGRDVPQIIAENAKERQIALPLQLLTQIVRASHKATHDFLSWYLLQACPSNTVATEGRTEAAKHERKSSTCT